MGDRAGRTRSISSLGGAGTAHRAKSKGPARPSKPFTLAPTVGIPAVLDEGGGADLAFRQLLYDISIAAAHLESAREYLAGRLGVTSPQYNMLMVIAQYDDDSGVSVSDVAAHLHVSNTFVTTEVKKLVTAGLVSKQANPDDARSVLLRLTTAGEAAIRALEPELLFVNNHLFQNISKEDFRLLSRIIASLIGDFSQTVAILGVMANRSPAAASAAKAETPGATRRIARRS